MPMQEFFDFGRVDVLTAADDHLLASPDDSVVSILTLLGQVACVQPARAVDRACRRFWVAVVARHDAMAANTQFARLARRYVLAGGSVDQLHLEAGNRMTDGSDANLDRVVNRGECDQRGSFGLPVADADFA